MYVVLVIALVWSILAGFVLALLRAAALGERAAERQARERRVRRAAEARLHTGRVALAVVALPLIGANAPDASAAGCAGERSAPGRSGPQVTLCLVNAERRARGVSALTTNGRLARAAHGHAADMVARGYFAHTAPGGITFATRLRQAGYAARCAWRAGETLAWGAGEQATPASRVAAWMHSRPHRQILLEPAFRELGVGIVAGAPGGGGAAFTYVAEFGRRRC